jgi:hypothetical protein
MATIRSRSSTSIRRPRHPLGRRRVYTKQAPATDLNESKLPLLLVTAGYDPVSLAPDAYDLTAKVCARDGNARLSSL